MGRDDDFIKKILTATDMENLSLDVSVNKCSRDLLQRFRGSVTELDVLKEKKDEEIELNLGLSLGGRFGVDKSCSKNSLVRSSSIAVFSTLLRDDDNDLGELKPVTGLVRTSSMPVETEEDWRKRKELQTLRRMEAKRRRSEKQRDFIRADKEIGGTYGVAMAKESKGGSSSSVSDLEANVLHGSSSEPSPTSILSLKANNLDIGSSGTKLQENTNKISDIAARSPCKKSDTSRAGGEKMGGTNTIEDMPCVFTMGDGPNGRRVDGILYKYGKGEEVRIMCICCGKFHSPAEFVKHAGGTDVDHPLKHIVVNAYAPSLL